jgi:hypothetical protein
MSGSGSKPSARRNSNRKLSDAVRRPQDACRATTEKGEWYEGTEMKNPPHAGFSVRVDCLEPHGLSVTEGEDPWCVEFWVESSGEPNADLS